MKPKFDDCEGCKWFNRTRPNPICGECGVGEFFEQRRRSRELTDNELMMEFRRMSRDDY